MQRLTFFKCLGGCLVSVLTVVCLSAGMIVGVGVYYRNQLDKIPIESEEVQVKFDGHERIYRIYVPENLTEPAPLVFVMHGGRGEATSMEQMTRGRFNELADRDGFIVVYPQGLDNEWNDGREGDFQNSDEHSDNRADDVGYFRFMIDEVSNDYAIDQDRIFATGISNGGHMSMRLACDLSDRIAAVGIVTAQMSVSLGETCDPQENVGILIMNGTSDPMVPYDGGDITVFFRKRGKVWSTDTTIDFWIDRYGCGDTPTSEAMPDPEDDGMRVTRYEYQDCGDGAVVLYRVENGGHTLPGGIQYLPSIVIGNTNQDIVGADEIWAFFQSME